MNLNHKRAGLTLVETAIGITIISIAFYAIISIFINLVPRAMEAEKIHVKVFLAQERMEEYLVRSFSAITNEAPANFGGDFSLYWNRIEVAYVNPDNLNFPITGTSEIKNVKVKVWGGTATAAGTIELVTLVITNEAP